MTAPAGDVSRERAEAFKKLGLKHHCPVCAKKIGRHCPRKLHNCLNTYVEFGGPRPYRR
jgi:hypothetical protein